MKILILLTAMAVLVVALPMPEAGATPPEAVDFKVAEELAVRKASAEWPGSRLGLVIPYLDEDGTTVAWMFQFRVDGSRMPDYEEVVAEVLADRGRLTMNTDLSRWASRNAVVLVSARADRTPILSYGYGVSGFYALADKALARAAERMDGRLWVSRMYFVFPVEYVEVANDRGQTMVFSQYFERAWHSRSAFRGYVRQRKVELRIQFGDRRSAAAAVHRQEWIEVLERDFRWFVERFVPEHGRAPFYDWSYGCTPTSAAMVCGYIDRVLGYGRLVDWFWQRFDMVEGEMDWQIPNVQRQCAIQMWTDTTSGGTSIGNISRGLRDVFEFENGYGCSMTDVTGGPGNDWAWSTITSEIDGGHCMVWSALWEIHSLACYGYRTPDKDVYVHNTWWRPAAWWHYSGDDWSHVASPHPENPDPHELTLTHPLGDTNYSSIGRGEVLQVGDTVTVTWDNGGRPATTVDVDLSTDGGFTWSPLAADLPDNGSYEWYLAPETRACDTVRIRLRQYSGTTLTAGDGSYGCFRIRREPLPPVQVAPPNGQQIFSPPIVLAVDTLPPGMDSVEFRLIATEDTIWVQQGTSLTCPVPDSLFERRSYKWVVRGHNRFGWGEYSSPWTFWVRFSGIADGGMRPDSDRLLVAAVGRSGHQVVFGVGRTTAGARIEVFDALGNSIVRLDAAQRGLVSWDCRDRDGRWVPAGLYFVRLESDAAVLTRKLLLLD